MLQNIIKELKEFPNVLEQYIKNINRRVSARHNIKQMKTKTGLTIIHDGNRVNVYTQKEIEQLDKKNDYDNDVIIVLTLSALLITIGLIIGLSI